MLCSPEARIDIFVQDDSTTITVLHIFDRDAEWTGRPATPRRGRPHEEFDDRPGTEISDDVHEVAHRHAIGTEHRYLLRPEWQTQVRRFVLPQRRLIRYDHRMRADRRRVLKRRNPPAAIQQSAAAEAEANHASAAEVEQHLANPPEAAAVACIDDRRAE